MATLRATSLVQRSPAALTSCHSAASKPFFNQSALRPSSLSFPGLKPQEIVRGVHYLAPQSAIPHEPSGPKRGAGIARGGSVRRLQLTHTEEDKVKETLEFYIHEIRGGPEVTLKLAAGTGNGDLTKLGFGSYCVFDNEVREGISRDSTLIGRERGFGQVTDLQSQEGLQLESRITFGENSKYKGSTLTFNGNVGGATTPYELIIIGGTGHFRGAKGYVVADNCPPSPPDFVFHWNVVITH